jgi:hypothetical protein
MSEPRVSVYTPFASVKVKGQLFELQFDVVGSQPGFHAHNNESGVGIFIPLEEILNHSQLTDHMKLALMEEPRVWSNMEVV